MDYRFLGYDEGKQTLATYDTTDPSWGWEISLSELPMGRDLQLLSANRALVGFDRGYFEVDLKNGDILKVVDRWVDVTSVRRLQNGDTLVTGQNLVSDGISVLTLNKEDKIQDINTREGDYVRMMRPTNDGTYLLGSDDHFLETDKNLQRLRAFAVPGFEHAWMSYRYKDGSTLISAGYGGFMSLFSPDGELIKVFGSQNDVPETVSPFFYAAFEVIKNGHILVCNWQGHGDNNGHKGRQLIEFDEMGNYLSSWSNSQRISSLQGILVLDKS